MNNLYFKYLKNFALVSVIPTASGVVTFSLTTIRPVQAFSIDFRNPGVIQSDGTRTINSSVELNAIDLDGSGQNIDLDLSDSTPAATYSTAANNIIDLWTPLGIDITINGTLGLFNSECIPGGGSNSAAAPANIPCNIGGSNGDPDLATGNGSYTNGMNVINFNTTPQGNLLIREENPGNSIPDDASNGDILINFNQSILSQVRLESVTIVDDAEGNIIVTFTDNSQETISFNSSLTNPITGTNGNALLLNPSEFSAGENALARIGGFTQNDVASLKIDFVGSGGFGAFDFIEFSGSDVKVPLEFSPSLGLLLSGASLFGVNYFRNKRALSR